MTYPASAFKAHCLKLIDRVRETAEPIIITKRGRVVARLVAAGDDDDRPWEKVRGTVRWAGDPLRPAIDEADIEALK